MSQPVLYFSLPSLDYFIWDGKVSNFAFYGSNNKILFLLTELRYDPVEFNFRRVLPIFDKVGRQDSCCQNKKMRYKSLIT